MMSRPKANWALSAEVIRRKSIMMLVKLAIAVTLVPCMLGQLQAHSCSISCPGNTPIPAVTGDDNRRLHAGAPGKRGAIGPRGLPGPVAEKGSKGERGEPCNCEALVDEMEHLRTSITNLQKFMLTDRGWLKASNGRWYQHVKTPMTYQRGREVCRNSGGILASVGMRNATIISEVTSLMGIGSSTQDWTWIGLTDAAREGVWVWDDGSTEQVTSWLPGQPDNAGSRENCGHIYGGLTFNDNVCTENLKVLCETSKL